ncbi:MAG: right-handed parallel beta-helix repeat-containing protein [Promethearchaeota archaeon]
MRRKVIKTSLLVIALMISITIPIIAVTAKKKEWEIDPIIIDEYAEMGPTWADLADKPWLKGSGTPEDPYMIKNVVIDANGLFFCMLIMNSEAYFKIMDCTFSNTGPNGSPDGTGKNAAIILVNTQNGVIFKNEMFECGFPGTGLGGGIALVASSNNKVQKNFCHDNELSGIYVQYSYDNVIRQNLCTGNTYGIFLMDWSNNNEVTKNECYDNNEDGILVVTESNNNMITKNECKGNLNGGITVASSHGNIVTDNECSENEGSGIYLTNSNDNLIAINECNENLASGIDVESSYGNSIIENLCSGNARPNIYLKNSNDNLITQNLCAGSGWGIVLRWSTNNEVTMNDCIENGEGIVLQQESTDNRITDNTCTNNYERGIFLVIDANYNIVTQNICSENLLSGIGLWSSSGNVISKNDCNDNGESGISITDPFDINARDNILYGNKIVGNLNGINFSEADNNDVFRNIIKENDIGMIVEGQSAHNLIYQNNFIDNEVQALNEHAGLNNWHNIYMLEGNYWSDYEGEDSDGDGIGDIPWPWWDFDVHPFMEENGWEVLTPIEEEIQNARMNPDTNRLGGGRDYRANEMGYLIVGLGQLFSERTHDTWIPPYTCQLWFGVNEFDFEGNLWFFEWNALYQEPVWVNLFYIRIPPNFFTVMGLPLGVEFYYEWSISFYSGGEQQFMSFTSYFTLI